MLKFKTNGWIIGQHSDPEIMFKFSHSIPDERLKNGKIVAVSRRWTTCYCFVNGTIDCFEHTVCSSEDIFNKATGRKLALAKVLRKLTDKYPGQFTKDFRTKIWNSYFEISH